MVDRSDREAYEAALGDVRSRLRKAERVARMGFLDWNLKTGEVFLSDQVYKLFGIERQALHTRPELISRIIHPDEREAVQTSLDNAVKGIAPHDLDHRIIRPDGEVLWVHAQAEMVRDADGNPQTLLGTVIDITTRKEAEERRRELEVRIQRAKKLEYLGALTSGIAHQFNNLLVGILGSASLAIEEVPVDSPARKTIRTIEEAADRAADLVSMLLAYAGKGRFHVESVDLAATVRETAELLESAVSNRTILNFDLDESVPPVEADPAHVRRIIASLVANASDALGEDGGTISIATGSRTCGPEELEAPYLDYEPSAGLYSFIEVSDNGEGMDAETRERLFDPFFSTRFAGRGLGLAAVLGIVRRHKGAIKVCSEQGVGTRLTVLLPAI